MMIFFDFQASHSEIPTSSKFNMSSSNMPCTCSLKQRTVLLRRTGGTDSHSSSCQVF
jgi:hypothetical protein